MRRLTVVQLLPALESGGVERSTLEISEALVAAGHRAIVVSAGGRLLPALRDTGAEHIALDIGRKSLLTLRHVPALRKLFAREQADIVHARSRLPAWLGWKAVRGIAIAQRPHFVTTMHGLNSPGRYSAVMTYGERVICVSGTVRDYLLRHYPRTDAGQVAGDSARHRHGPFPACGRTRPALRGAFAREHPQLGGDGPLLLLPGRGTRLKGHVDALRLLAALRARRRGREAVVARRARGRARGLHRRTGRRSGHARHRRRGRVHRRDLAHRRGLCGRGPGAAAFAQARIVRPHRDRGAVGRPPGAGLGAWRGRRIAGRTAAAGRGAGLRRNRTGFHRAGAAQAPAAAIGYDALYPARHAAGHAGPLPGTRR